MVDCSGVEPDARILGDASGNLHSPHFFYEQETKNANTTAESEAQVGL